MREEARIVRPKRVRETGRLPAMEKRKRDKKNAKRDDNENDEIRKEIKCERSWSLAVSRAASIIND